MTFFFTYYSIEVYSISAELNLKGEWVSGGEWEHVYQFPSNVGLCVRVTAAERTRYDWFLSNN